MSCPPADSAAPVVTSPCDRLPALPLRSRCFAFCQIATHSPFGPLSTYACTDRRNRTFSIAPSIGEEEKVRQSLSIPQENPWKQIPLFLITLGVLVLCALLLQPFFSAIVGAIILAVVTRRPYDWLVTKVKNRSLCAAVAVVFVTLALIIPTYFLAQELGRQAYATINAFRAGAHQEKI